MEMTTDIPHLLREGDHVRLTRVLDTGRIQAITSDFVYVLMDYTNERRLFASCVDGIAALELIVGEDKPGYALLSL